MPLNKVTLTKVMLYLIVCAFHILFIYPSADRQLIVYDCPFLELTQQWTFYSLFPDGPLWSFVWYIHPGVDSQCACLYMYLLYLWRSLCLYTPTNTWLSQLFKFASLASVRWLYFCIYLKLSDYWLFWFFF